MSHFFGTFCRLNHGFNFYRVLFDAKEKKENDGSFREMIPPWQVLKSILRLPDDCVTTPLLKFFAPFPWKRAKKSDPSHFFCWDVPRPFLAVFTIDSSRFKAHLSRTELRILRTDTYCSHLLLYLFPVFPRIRAKKSEPSHFFCWEVPILRVNVATSLSVCFYDRFLCCHGSSHL